MYKKGTVGYYLKKALWKKRMEEGFTAAIVIALIVAGLIGVSIMASR